MLDLAYLVLLIALVWAVIRRRRPWISRVSAASQQALRLTAMVLAIAIGSLGCLVIAIQPPGQHGIYRWLGYAVGSTMLVGALLYAIGLVVWLDRSALALRLSGWMLMAAALVVPSTLTLALPVVAAMVATLADVPSGRGPQRSTLGDPSDGSQGSAAGIGGHMGIWAAGKRPRQRPQPGPLQEAGQRCH